MAGIPAETPKTRVPLPPTSAKVVTTACEYCPVACGYKAYIWPAGTEGGPKAADNALKVDFPTRALSGRWPSPNMHTTVTIDGRLQNVLIMPDPDADVVNVGGNHSVRGGTLALKLYRPDGPTHDRLQRPLLRVNGTLQPISWDAATDIVAAMIRHVVDEHGELAMGFKHYSYEFFENTYTITKFALGAIGTPNVMPHHNTAGGTDTPGLDDSGVDAFSAAYEDYKEAEVLMILGTDPYETKTVAFTQWIAPGGAKIIHVEPRKTFTSSYAEANGGLHLQVKPGTDAWVIGAISRVILERGWEDSEFIRDYVTQTRAEIEADGSWRRRRFGRTWEEFREEALGSVEFELNRAAAVTGVPAAKIERAAELLAKPVEGERPKSTLLYEKGLYWTHNYENTAALGNLSVLIGARGRPGRATSRMGGHQRGGISGAPYPLEKSPTEFEGQKVEMDCDRWTSEGKTRMVWSIGNDWVNGSGASNHLGRRLREMTRETAPQITSAVPSVAIGQLKERVDGGGMFIVQNEIYLNDNSEFADLVLPAATWGEENFTRNNAERRLRLYGKIMDPPGEAKPDWRIVAEVAQKMGFEGFDWKDSNEVFEESGPRASGRKDYSQLVERAQSGGVRAHDVLRALGTTGIQTPVKLEGGQLKGTVRLHEDLKFKGPNGKSNFVFVDMDAVKERNALLGPNEDEFWVLSGRVNHLWQSLYDDMRKPHLIQRYPVSFVEMHPDDARRMGVQSGDMLAIESDRVRTQEGTISSGGFTAVAYVTDEVQPGTIFAMFHYPGSPVNSVVTADAASQPINPRQPFKFGRGKVTRIGSTDLADVMSFVPRNLV
ncbi:MAG: arsenate reductase (azurin) large subunit [Dehalococcoidia bacterium]